MMGWSRLWYRWTPFWVGHPPSSITTTLVHWYESNQTSHSHSPPCMYSGSWWLGARSTTSQRRIISDLNYYHQYHMHRVELISISIHQRVTRCKLLIRCSVVWDLLYLHLSTLYSLYQFMKVMVLNIPFTEQAYQQLMGYQLGCTRLWDHHPLLNVCLHHPTFSLTGFIVDAAVDSMR